MKVDRRLNLVLETENPDGLAVHVHSVPISRAIWEANYRLITKTMVTIYGDGLTPGAGTRVGMLYLKDTAKMMDAANGTVGVQERQASALMTEIWRLTNAAMITKAGGWETIPFQEIIDKNLLDSDTLSEVENTLVFFTLASWFHQEKERQDFYTLMNAYGGRTTSSDITEYQNLLRTSTQAGNSGGTASPSSMQH